MENFDRITFFQQTLLGSVSIRDFPWRYKTDAYQVLVSEFMLHRTRTDQVVPIYESFITNYPTLKDFIHSDRETVMLEIKSLGLNWRLNGMIRALTELWDQYKEVPTDIDTLISIEGIGQYIAGAVFCFTTNRRATLIDTNIVRVIGRYEGLRLEGEARRRKEMIRAIELACPDQNPRGYYYAIIDLAHTICITREPLCTDCPLNSMCRYP